MLTHFKRFFSIFHLRPFELASPLIFCLSLLGVFHAWSGPGWMNCKALRLEGGGAEAEAEAEAGAAGKEDEAAASLDPLNSLPLITLSPFACPPTSQPSSSTRRTPRSGATREGCSNPT
jgi:hypothetical protein